MRYLLLMILLSGCGDINVPEENQLNEKKEDTETRDDQGENIPNLGTKNHVEVSVEVQVDINQLPEDAPKYIFNAVQKKWEDAINHAPDGYRLMTRADILIALESGDLDDILSDDAVIWSSSEYENAEMSYFFSHLDQGFTPGLKMLRFSSLYVAE